MSSNTFRRSTLRAPALMASDTMASRILGLMRNAVFIVAVGATAGGVGTAFQTVNTPPNMVFNLLASGIFDAVLVPQIVGAIKRRNDGDICVNRLSTPAGTLSFPVTFAMTVLVPVLVMTTAAGYTEGIRNLTILFALLCLPQFFLHSLYNLLGELLNAREIFGPYMWALVVNNVVGIAGLGAFFTIWGDASDGGVPAGDLTGTQLQVLAGSATLGVICQALCLLWPMHRAGVSFGPDFHFRRTSFGSMSRVAGWTFTTLSVSQVGVLSTNNLAVMADGFIGRNGTQGGVVNILAYSTTFMIFMVSQSLITVSLTTAIFTRMTGVAADSDDRVVAGNYHLGMCTTVSLTLVAAAMLIAGSVSMMGIAMTAKGGDPEAVAGYALVLAPLVLGVASIGTILMSQRVLFAYKDVKPVSLVGIGPTILQVIVGWLMYALTGARWWVIVAALGETACRLTQGTIAVVWVSRENCYIDRAGLLCPYVSYLAAAITAGIVGLGLPWLMGIYTEIPPTLGRMALAGVKLSFVPALTGLAHLLVLRFAAPGESAVMIRPLLTRLRVPGAVVNILAASFTSTPASAKIMMGHTPNETEEPIAPTPERSGDDEKLPLSDEVLSTSPIPALPTPPAAPTTDEVKELTDNAAEELVDTPPAPAPAEVPTLGPVTQASIENPLVAEAMVIPIVDDIAEATEVAQAQVIPESLAEYGIEPVTGEVEAVQVEAPAFSLAPPSLAPAASGYGCDAEVNPEDYPYPAPLMDSPSAHQIPCVQAPEAVPAPPVKDATEVMDPVPPMPTASVQDAPASSNEEGSSKHLGMFVDPMRPVLIFGVILVLFGAIWGLWMVTRPVTDLDLTQSLRAGIPQQQPNEEPSPAFAMTPPPAPTTTPVIPSVQVLLRNSDDGNRPDRAINIIDSNPATSWSSCWFGNSQLRDETSVTIVVKFQQKATVPPVTLTVDLVTSSGEVAACNITDLANPRGGTELTTPALSPTIMVQLPMAVGTDSIALQFRSVPKGQDGRNWAWISELTVQ